MQSFLITNNKGGSGKTFIAVHLAKLLSEKGRVLLLDCDSQADAYQFYANKRPTKEKEKKYPSYECKDCQITLQYNKDLFTLKKLKIFPEQYDYIIIDVDAGIEDSIRVMLDNKNEIDKIIVPMNHQLKSVYNFKNLLDAVARVFNIRNEAELTEINRLIERREADNDDMPEEEFIKKIMGYIGKNNFNNVILTLLNTDEEELNKTLKDLRVKTKVNISLNMINLPKSTDIGRRKFIWDNELLGEDEKKHIDKFFKKLLRLVLK